MLKHFLSWFQFFSLLSIFIYEVTITKQNKRLKIILYNVYTILSLLNENPLGPLCHMLFFIKNILISRIFFTQI